jgi:ribosomal protein RSM22 (predicted rRNA methylase)
MKLSQTLPHLLHIFSGEHDLLKAISEVSEKFTTNRGKITDYLKDPRLASAYTAFYLTTNYPKLEGAMKWFPDVWKDAVRGRPLIDLGAGPGTFGLAWRELMNGKVYQIESSQTMREQARKLWDGTYPAAEMEQLNAPKEIPDGVLLFGHSANEMGAAQVLTYIKKINPEHILFIEPGTKTFFPEMLAIRRELIAQNFNVIYPCPSAHECPMATSDKDWCHQFLKVKQDPEVERLSQMLHKDRKLLPLIVHLYSKTTKHNDKERLVRVLPETKFSFEWEVCLGDHIAHDQVMLRGLDKKQQKDIDEVLAGAALSTELEKDLGAVKRVKVIAHKP